MIHFIGIMIAMIFGHYYGRYEEKKESTQKLLKLKEDINKIINDYQEIHKLDDTTTIIKDKETGELTLISKIK